MHPTRSLGSLLALALPVLGLLPPAPVQAVEAAVRVGLSSPQGDRVGLGPTMGLSLGLPLRGRIGLMASADYSTHAVADHPDRRIDSLSMALGLEASLDLAPVVPVLSIGPVYQHAWRRDVDGVGTDKLGGFVGAGLRATLLEHLRLGLHARYLTAGFTSDSFPAFATFVCEVGWTS